MSRERITRFFELSREMYSRASSGKILSVTSRYREKIRFLCLWLLVHLLIEARLLKVMSQLVLSLYMGVTGLVCSHFLMLGKAPTIATRATIAGHPVKSLSSIRAFGWVGRGTFIELTNW